MTYTIARLALVAALSATASCTTSMSNASMSRTPPTPDPRVGLKAGWFNAGEAIWNLTKVSTTPPSPQFLNLTTPGDGRLTNSDIAFAGNYAFQGNYSGWQVWDITQPSMPTLRFAYVCPGSQSDVTVYGNLLFVSAEATSGRVDCGLQGVADTVSKERARGIRILDISDVAKPRYVTTVQTCRGSHTNTLVTDPNDKENVYIYVSGSSSVRSPNELAGCSALLPDVDPNSALFRIEVIRVPLARPELAAIVSSPRIFENLAPAPRHAEVGEDAAVARQRAANRPPRPGDPRRGPTQCHDITSYPAIGLAGGACSGYGLLIDIRDVVNPKRVEAVADSNFSAWHSATFNNEGTQVLFSDEWGGGGQPRCRATDRKEWGGDAIFAIENNKLVFKSYFKLPAPQTPFENCVSHNGSLIPVPGRDIMVQSWYQGGINIFDWSDPSNVFEIAYFDRGPMDATQMVQAGHWSVYWYNGFIYGSEIARGLDVFELKPSAWLTQNEIDAAKTVRFAQFNAQEQPKLVWPASFSVVRAYLDQVVRLRGLKPDRTKAIDRQLTSAERMTGASRSAALNQLATELGRDAMGATDAARVRKLAEEVRRLAGA